MSVGVAAMLGLPFFDRLQSSRRILIAGAGGGFDVFAGLPLFFGLMESGRRVWLGNLSFTHLNDVSGRWLTPDLIRVDSGSVTKNRYFPEGYLSKWFHAQGEEVPVYCFRRTGVKPLRAAYETLAAELELDTILLVDGGTDSMMRGDEAGLGTPHEDVASIAAVDDVGVPTRLLACIGFGIDHWHGVCHAHFLEAVADVIRAGGFLGVTSLLAEMPEVSRFRSAFEFVSAGMPHDVSIVSSSILAAVAGCYGDHHSTARTRGSRLYINPLMSLYWFFSLDAVARRILYIDEIKISTTYEEVDAAIMRCRKRLPRIRPDEPLPM